MQCVMRSRK